MKPVYKIVLINIGVAALITLFVMTSYHSGFRADDAAFAFGMVCLGMSLITFFTGLILLLTSKRQWGIGLLLSSATLLLLSGISCSSGLSGLRF